MMHHMSLVAVSFHGNAGLCVRVCVCVCVCALFIVFEVFYV